MKKLLLLSVVALFTLTTCKKPEDPIANTKLTVNAVVMETTINLSFVNTKSKQLIGADDKTKVTVTISGTNESDVIDNSGFARTEYKSDNGYLGLALIPGIIPSETNPVRFTLVAKKDGYQTTSLQIKLFNKGNHQYQINMVTLSALPDGVTQKTDNSANTNSSGTLQTQLSMETTPQKTTDPKATIQIESGTVIKDASGNFLTGNLTSTLVFYNTLTESSLLSFPGGFTPTVNRNGKEENVFFISAGFLSLDIKDASGRYAKSFSVPITVDMQVPTQMINPLTNSPVAAGEVIPIWSYEPDSGIWNYEGDASLSGSGSNGFLNATFKATHLSYWNIDYHYGPNCGTGAKIKFILPSQYNSTPLECYLKFIRKSTGTMPSPYSQTWESLKNGSSITLYNAPANIPVTLEIYDQCGGTLLKSIEISNLCSGVYTVDLSGISVPTTTISNVTINLTGHCANKPNLLIKPSFWFYYREKAASCNGYYYWNPYGYMTNGSLTLYGLKIGKTYLFGGYFNNGWVEKEITVDKTSYVLDIDLSNELCSKY